MAGAVTGLHVFAGDVGPEALSLLDGNYSALATAVNTLVTFGNNYIDSGAVNGAVVTVPAPQVFAYTDGVLLYVKIAATNTSGTPTINVNALGAKQIVNIDGSNLGAAQLVGGGWALLQYEAGIGKFMLLSSNGGAGVFSTGLTLASGVINSNNNTNGDIQHFFRNANGGTAADVRISMTNDLHRLMFGVTSSTFSGAFIPGGPTGETTFFDTTAGPLVFGTTDTTRMVIAANGSSITGYGPTALAQVDMTPDTGSFTITYSGMTAAVTGTAVWSRVGKLVTIMLPGATGTSNSVNFLLSGIPANLQPATFNQFIALAMGSARDNGAVITNPAVQVVAATGSWTMFNNGSANWTAAGSKGIVTPSVFSYFLN